MIAVTISELMLLVVISGGNESPELAALIEPTHYFKARQIPTSLDRLIDFAITEPKTAKFQIRQLTVLRHFADEADQFKKAKNYETNRLAIEEIAAGKRANDSEGFAQEYAKRVLDKLDGVKAPPAKVRPMREDALSWFPADTRFAWALDLRQTHGVTNDPLKEMAKMMPNQAKLLLYDQLEKVGNVRIERLAFGVVDAPKADDQKLFLRFTGKGNPAWIADGLAGVTGGNFQTRRVKNADGTPTLLLQDNRGPTLMLVGNTDVLFVGNYRADGKSDAVFNEVLDVRARKKPNAADGALKNHLAKIPDKAFALVVGDLSDEMRKGLNSLVDPFPATISGHMERTPTGIDVTVDTGLTDADEAGKLVKKVGAMRKEAVQAVQEAMKMPVPDGPPVPYQGLINLMESVQMQSKDNKVHLRGLVPNGLVQQLGQASLFHGDPGRFDAPPPFPKDFKK